VAHRKNSLSTEALWNAQARGLWYCYNFLVIKTLASAIACIVFFAPYAAFALISTNEAQPPGNCERSCQNTNYAAQCAPGGVLKGASIDAQCSGSRLGIPTYTAELTTYGNTNGCSDSSSNFSASGVEKCASGSCTSFNGQPVLGVAHRTFPFGTRLEVCNLKNQICAIATVVDRGPADYLQRRTIDAYSTLSKALEMNCGTVPASYKVLSGPGIDGEVQPSGPTVAGIQAILDAQRNGNGVGPGMTYTAAQTPFGYGYVGTPPPIGSSAYTGLGTPSYNTPYTQTYPVQTTYPQTTTTNPTPATGTNSVASPGNPALAIKVWPHSLLHGQTLLVYWTSVNMAQNSCQVLFQNQLLSSGNEGVKPLKTTSFDPGTLSFTLQCTDQNGQQYSSNDSATLQ
jgi:hypothetical protein